MDIKTQIDSFIHESYYQYIIKSEEFYFEELSLLFGEFKNYDISLFKDKLENFASNPTEKFRFQDLLDNNQGTPFYDFLLLIGKMIVVMDEKGYNGSQWHPYSDKRRLSRANFTQRNWTYCFIKYKLNNFTFQDIEDVKYRTFKYSILYISEPKLNVNISSFNHREQIANYFQLNNASEITSLFDEYTSTVKNEANKSVLVTSILYNPAIKRLWRDGAIGLMASDGQDWLEGTVNRILPYDACILWNNRRPNDPSNTLKALRNIISEGNTFYLYYSSGSKARYRAEIIDFVENQKELDEKNWPNSFTNILEFSDKFDNYKGEKFSAKIVFLASTFEKIEPISVSEFEFYGKPPTQSNLSPIKSEPKITGMEKSDSKNMNVPDNGVNQNEPTPPLNQILFGPPGTGKTYNTINKALEIINEAEEQALDWRDRDAVKTRFDKRLREGRIVFTTFHQSMSYEDFIEGIKPETIDNQVVYNVQNGIFKNISIDAAFSIAQHNKSENTQSLIDFSEQYDEYLVCIDEKLSKEEVIKLETKSKGHILVDGISPNRNIIIKHIGGSRNYIVSKDRLTKINQAFSQLNEVNNIDLQFRSVIGGSNASAYWAVLNDIRKTISNTVRKSNLVKTYTSDEKELVVSSMLSVDYKSKEAENFKPFVLIIDEINRGNVSQIFGELITLIEDNKRLGAKEALELTLPYSKKSFGVPSNLYIIGTMNTADRSVEALDTALRRRFSFEEMPPQYKVIKTEGKLKESEGKLTLSDNSVVDLVKILDTINSRIEVLLSRDNLIGHSYFLDVDSETALKKTIFRSIIPLLQEYFYGDYGKIGLVLGDGFIKLKRDENKSKMIFAKFKEYEDTEGVQKRVYELISEDNVDINAAIKSLLNGES